MFCTLIIASLCAIGIDQALGDAAKACSATTCASDVESAVIGSAMLQVRQSSSPLACSLERAKQAPLTEEGFGEVSKSCCYEDMKEFMGRLVDDMGLKVCDTGGLSGITPFYSCPPYAVTLAQLKEDFNSALQDQNSKCHWLADRYDECREPSLECAVSVQKPPPAPQPVASGFIAFKVTNPSEMVRSPKAIDVMKNELALEAGVDTSYVNVVIGSGPLDGEEVVSSFMLVPSSQAFYSTKEKTKLCKVFAAYSFQESAAVGTGEGPTPAPALDEATIVDKMKHFDTTLLGNRLSQDLDDVDRVVGTVEVLETSTCEKTTGKCSHNVIKEA
jgi:hypothetical protein